MHHEMGVGHWEARTLEDRRHVGDEGLVSKSRTWCLVVGDLRVSSYMDPAWRAPANLQHLNVTNIWKYSFFLIFLHFSQIVHKCGNPHM